MASVATISHHRLGLSGNFSLDESLLETAREYGLRIEYLGQGRYELRSTGDAFRVENFCPSFIRHEGPVFDFQNLKQFLQFLHQPVRRTVERQDKNTRAGMQFLDPAARRAVERNHIGVEAGRGTQAHIRMTQHETRQELHQALRFMTTGSVEIPPALDEEGKPAEPGCHADAEARLKDMDSWREEKEFGNRRDVYTAIPGSTSDPEKGFIFNLHPEFMSGGDESPAGQALSRTMRALIGNARGSHEFPDQMLHLKASEFEALCAGIIRSDETRSLLRRAKFEQQLRAARAATNLHALDLGAMGAVKEPQIRLLLQSTSALTPVVNSKTAQKVWQTFHITKKDNSPFGQIADEYAVFNEQLRHLLESGEFNPAQAEALLHQNASLVAFSRILAAELGMEGVEAAITGAQDKSLAAAEDFLEPRHQAALEAVRSGLEQGRSPLGQFLVGAKESIKTVIIEGASYTVGTKWRARWLTVLSAAYIASNAIPSVQKKLFEMAGASNKPAAAQAYVFGDDNKMQAVQVQGIIPVAAPVAAANGRTQPGFCHYHVRGTQFIPHCIFNEKIKDFSNGTLDAAERFYDNPAYTLGLAKFKDKQDTAPFSHFSVEARKSIDRTANFWLMANILQLIAHIPFFSMMFARGAKHGLRGYKHTGSLFAEFTDALNVLARKRPLAIPASVLATGLAIGGGFGITGTILSTALGGLIGNRSWRRSSDLKDQLRSEAHDIALAESLVNAAHERAVSADALLGDFDETPVNIKIAGLKRQFEISNLNLQPALDALARFDTAILHAAEKVGIEHDWYADALHTKINETSEALAQFRADGNGAALQRSLAKNFPDIMGAQARQMDRTDIYNVAFGAPADEKTEKLLHRHGNAQFGALKRRERIGRHVAAMRAPRAAPKDSIVRDIIPDIFNGADSLKNGVKRAGREVWAKYEAGEARAVSGAVVGINGLNHGIARSFREMQAQYERVPHKKAIGIAFAASAAACVALDLSGQTQVLGPMGKYIADHLSGVILGRAYGGSVATVAFGTYNIWDDTVLTDTVGGLIFLSEGVLLGHFGYKYGAKPAVVYAREKMRDMSLYADGTQDLSLNSDL